MKEIKRKRKVLAVVNDFKIMSDTLYDVVGKHDGSAPQAFQDANIAKAPFKENSTYIVCPYDDLAKVYDTGFYPRSRCYDGMDRTEVAKMVEDRVNNIKIPYEQFIQNTVEQNNFDFWDSMSCQVYMGKTFNTAIMVDLFELYIGVHSGQLTPLEMDGDPRFMNSMYCFREKEGSRDFIQQREINKMNISYKFMSALKGDKKERQAVIDLLLYIGIVTRPDITEDEYYVGTLSNWINGKPTNVDNLLDVWDRSSDKSFREVLEFNRIINILQRRGRVSMSPSGLQYNGQVIGPDPRTAAELVATQPGMSEARAGMLNDYEEIVVMDGMAPEKGGRKPQRESDEPGQGN